MSFGGEGGGAVAISDNRLIVGWVYPRGLLTPAVWVDGVFVSLPTWGNGGYTSDVNDAGQIVGSVYVGASLRSALWKDGELRILPLPLPLPLSDSQAATFTATANRINVAGEPIGTVRYGSDSVAKTRQGISNETVSFQHGGRNNSGKTNANVVYSVPFTVPNSQKPKTQIPLTIAYPGAPSAKASSANGVISVR